MVAPVMFAVGLALIYDLVLDPSLQDHWAPVLATLAVAIGAFAFATFIFSLLDRIYRQLEEQRQRLERQAAELRVLAEAERRRTEEWRMLFELGQEVTASPNLEGLLNSVVTRAKELLSTDVSLLMLISPDGKELRTAAHVGLITPEMRRLRLAPGQGLQGLVLEMGQPLIIEDYQTDPRLRNRPASAVAKEGLVSEIAVTLSGRGGVLGTLAVANRQPTRFDERQAELLQAFAHWAAVAIETSHLYEKVKSLARLEERERIGMDLHDGVIQSIYAVGLHLEDCSERVDQSPQEVRSSLGKAMDDLSKVIKDIRSYIFDLRPQVSQVIDLPEALRGLVQDIRVNTLIDAELEIEGEVDGVLNEEQALAIFHVAQEALNNVSRHSRASSARVHLATDSSRVSLRVEDNGVGFDVKVGWERGKQGIRNMSDRARSVGASLTLESEPRRGTRVAMELPMAQPMG